jgi:crotonobetainyl-CoA:carnitine CoA-transferase CaiB-like acyl-CoA transferase
VYRCADGFVAVSALDDGEFRGLAKAMGKPGLAAEERFATVEARLVEEHAGALHAMLSEWAAGRKVAEVEKLGTDLAFGAAGVKKAEDHYRSRHLRERGSVWSVDDAIYGEVVEYGPIPKMSETPGRIKWAGKPVGYDNEKVLAEILGYDYLGIRTLEEEGIIGKWSNIMGRKPPEEMLLKEE